MGIRNIDKLIFEAPTRLEAIALYREWVMAAGADVLNVDTMIVRQTRSDEPELLAKGERGEVRR